MITEDKITEIFRIAYYFYKIFDAQMTKYTFKTLKFTPNGVTNRYLMILQDGERFVLRHEFSFRPDKTKCLVRYLYFDFILSEVVIPAPR